MRPSRRSGPVAHVVRTDALRGYAGLVRELGGDPDELLRRAGIRLQLAGKAVQAIPYQKLASLLHETALATGHADLGLRLAARQGGTTVLGPLEVAMRNLPTLGEAFDYYIAHAVAFSSAVSIVREREAETGRPYFRFEMYLSRLPHAQQVAEHAMGLLHHVIIALSAGKVRSRELWFSHGPVSPIADYRRYFGTRVEMNMPFTAIFLAEADLAVPIPDRAEALFQLADAFIDSEYSMATPLSARVRSVLTGSLASGGTSKQGIARQLGMHARTLERKLAAEGSGFRALIEEVRRDAAHRYLTETTLPITQIAAMLGFGEPAVLTRSCRRWFGCPPRELRNRATAGEERAADLSPADLARRVAALERENARLRQLVDRLASAAGAGEDKAG
jgi:AraC-like DNA-binding protein